MEAIGKGALPTKIDIKSEDELAQLAAGFNFMVISLKNITASRDQLDNEAEIRRKTQGEPEESQRVTLKDLSDVKQQKMELERITAELAHSNQEL